LGDIYRCGIFVKESLDCVDTVIASNGSLIQVKAIVSKEIARLEISILTEIYKLVYSSNNIGKEKPLALWVCLWTLILSYKSHVDYSKAGSRNPTLISSIREETEAYELSRHLCNTLTSIYSTIYRTTSPLTFDWRRDEVAELLGHNQNLIRLFCNIKTEMFWFRGKGVVVGRGCNIQEAGLGKWE